MTRSIRRSGVAGIVMTLLAPLLARAQALAPPRSNAAYESPRIEIVATGWHPYVEAILAGDAPGSVGTAVDLESDLGLREGWLPDVQLVIRPARKHALRFEYLPIKYDARAVLTRPVEFNGGKYRAGTEVTSELDWKTYRLGYEYDVVHRTGGSVRVIVEARHTDLRLRLTSTDTDDVVRSRIPFPAAGVAVRFHATPRIRFDGETTVFAVPDSADRHYGGHYVDVSTSATLTVTRHFGAQVGFRSIRFRHLGETNFGKLTLHGLSIGALVTR